MVCDVAYCLRDRWVKEVWQCHATRVQGGCISRVFTLVSCGCVVYIPVATCCFSEFAILTKWFCSCRGKVHLQGAVKLDYSFYVDEGKLEQKLIDATRVLCSDYGSKQYYV